MADKDAPEPKKSKKKLIVVILALLILGGAGGAGGWWWFMGRADSDQAAETPKKKVSETPVFLPLDQFTVNLQPEGNERYFQTAITLQIASKEDAEQLKLYMPQIRSRIIMLLTSKKASEILTAEGKKKLSDEIKTQVSLPMTTAGQPLNVTNVFFTSFVIQ